MKVGQIYLKRRYVPIDQITRRHIPEYSSLASEDRAFPVSVVTRRLTTKIRSEKRVVRRFRCANVIESTYTNLDSTAYCTPRLYGIAYCS